MNHHYSLGGCGDSFYEYRVKSWIAGRRGAAAAQAMREGWEGMVEAVTAAYNEHAPKPGEPIKPLIGTDK